MEENKDSIFYSLSNDDIKIELEKDGINPYIIAYSDLEDFDLEQITSTNPLIILYQIVKSYGHWVLLTRRPKECSFIYFDSYGGFEDFFKRAEEHLPTRKWLMEKLKKIFKKCKIYYNEIPFQLHKPPVCTCGRYAVYVAKMVNKGYSLYQIQRRILDVTRENKISADELMTLV